MRRRHQLLPSGDLRRQDGLCRTARVLLLSQLGQQAGAASDLWLEASPLVVQLRINIRPAVRRQTGIQPKASYYEGRQWHAWARSKRGAAGEE